MRNLCLLFASFVIVIFIECKQEAKTKDPIVHKNLINKEVKTLIDDRINKGINQSIIIGVLDRTGVDIYANGVVSAQLNHQPDQYTLYEIGSITKVFTGLLLADRVVKQNIQLTDSIGAFLPDSIELKDKISTIQLKQLATHSGGLDRQPGNLHTNGYNPNNPYAHYSGTLLLDELKKHELIFEPGSTSRYSNLGMSLLGFLLSNDKGKDYFEHLSQDVLSPLKMNHTKAIFNGNNSAQGYVFGVPVDSWDFDALAGAGALKSNIHDMLLFLSAQLGLTETPLDQAIQLSQQQHFEVEEGKAIGLAWGIYTLESGDKLYRHNGGTAGFRSFIGFLEQEKKGVIVLTNSSEAGVDDIGLHQLDQSFELKTGYKTSNAKVTSSILERKNAVDLNELLSNVASDSLNKDWGELNYLGYTYLKKGENEKAITVFQLNNELHPNSADGFDSLGEAFFENGQLEEALHSYQKALALDPNYENAKRMIEKINKLR